VVARQCWLLDRISKTTVPLAGGNAAAALAAVSMDCSNKSGESSGSDSASDTSSAESLSAEAKLVARAAAAPAVLASPEPPLDIPVMQVRNNAGGSAVYW